MTDVLTTTDTLEVLKELTGITQVQGLSDGFKFLRKSPKRFEIAHVDRDENPTRSGDILAISEAETDHVLTMQGFAILKSASCKPPESEGSARRETEETWRIFASDGSFITLPGMGSIATCTPIPMTQCIALLSSGGNRVIVFNRRSHHVSPAFVPSREIFAECMKDRAKILLTNSKGANAIFSSQNGGTTDFV